MKEYDDNRENDIINNNEQLMDAPKDSMTDIYNNLGSITAKLEFLIDNHIYLEARDQSPKNKVTEAEAAEKESLENDFINKYIVNGTAENHEHIFSTLGKLTGESIEHTYYEKENIKADLTKDKKVLKNEVETYEKQAYWIARNSLSGKTSDAINFFSKKFKDNFVKDAPDADIKKSNLTGASTMSDFFKAAGYSQREVTSHLQKLGVSPKKNMYTYYNEIYPGYSPMDITTVIKQDFAKHKAESCMANGSREYFVENKPYEEIKADLENINKKNRIKVSDEGIEEWAQNTGIQKLKKVKSSTLSNATKKYTNKYKNKSYIKEVIPEKQIYEATKKYKSMKTMEEKLDYLVLLYAMESSKNDLNAGSSNKSLDYATKIATTDFVKEFTNTEKLSDIKKYYNNVGKKAGEFTLTFQKERDEFLKSFPEDDPNRLDKANYLAQNTYEGGKRTSFSVVSQMILGYSSTMIDTIWNAANMSQDVTMGDFLKKAGYGEAEYNKFFADFPNVSPDTKAATHFSHDFFGNEQDPLDAMKKDFFDKTTKTWMNEGKSAFASKNKIKGEKLTQYNKDADFLASDYKIGKIRDWVNETGDKQIEGFIKDSYYEALNEHNKKYVGGENYDQYIRLHTGSDIKKKQVGDKQENLAKAIAASILKQTEKELDIKKIHSLAKTVKNLPDFKTIANDPKKLNYYLSGEGRIPEATTEALKCVAGINPDSVKAYVEAMKKLHDNMMSSEKRSDKYKDFYSAVEKISSLSGKYDFSNQADRLAASNELVALNTILLDKTIKYITNKETVRSSNDGIERFNNAMDALGIMHANMPNSRSNIDPVVQSINTKRHALPGSEKYVDIKTHNANRAEKAKTIRDLKNSNKTAEMAKKSAAKK